MIHHQPPPPPLWGQPSECTDHPGLLLCEGTHLPSLPLREDAGTEGILDRCGMRLDLRGLPYPLPHTADTTVLGASVVMPSGGVDLGPGAWRHGDEAPPHMVTRLESSSSLDPSASCMDAMDSHRSDSDCGHGVFSRDRRRANRTINSFSSPSDSELPDWDPLFIMPKKVEDRRRGAQGRSGADWKWSEVARILSEMRIETHIRGDGMYQDGQIQHDRCVWAFSYPPHI